MAHTDSHGFGDVCWLELATSDSDGAKSFYGGLLGWSAEDEPAGPEMVYTMFSLNGRKCAAGFQTKERPTHWALYFAVANADEAAARARELGGRVIEGPFDVSTHGRMAVIADPQGAIFCVWQAKDNPGLQVKGEPGALCWVDLNTNDQNGAKAFYSKFFGWEIVAGDTGYLHITAGKDMIGGIPSAEQAPKDVPPHWIPYLQVEDCDASTVKAKELGATICFGPVSMENVGRFTLVQDPQRAAFFLFQPASPGAS